MSEWTRICKKATSVRVILHNSKLHYNITTTIIENNFLTTRRHVMSWSRDGTAGEFRTRNFEHHNQYNAWPHCCHQTSKSHCGSHFVRTRETSRTILVSCVCFCHKEHCSCWQQPANKIERWRRRRSSCAPARRQYVLAFGGFHLAASNPKLDEGPFQAFIAIGT